MPTIAEQLTQLTSDRDDLIDNLTTQGISGLTGDETFTELVPKVLDIEGGGGGSIEEKTVIFYDYDGTIVNSYTKSEFLALESMPSNPSHSGLTAQGWNWSLADAKTYVTSHDYLNIGQMYVTDNGETRIYITLDDDDRLNPYLGIGINGTVTVDWGDGNTETITGTGIDKVKYTQHAYSTSGDYVIRISGGAIGIYAGSNNYSKLLGDSSTGATNVGYLSNITKVELGNNVKINTGAFLYCTALESITIPSNNNLIEDKSFQNCYSLKSITIPDGVTVIDVSVFQNCYSLESVAIPDSVTTINGGTFSEGAFQNCYSLKSITIPDSVTTLGPCTFNGCLSLQNITIPNSVTSIGTTLFQNCHSLKNVILPNTTTSITNGMFNNCYSLKNITIPDGVTVIDAAAFSGCQILQNVTIPSGVTSMGSSVFRTCYALESLTIPSGVTNIASYAFANMLYAKYFDFSTHTSIPTLANTNAFSSIASDCKIIVPDDLYDDWKAATNWSTYARRIVKESDYNA